MEIKYREFVTRLIWSIWLPPELFLDSAFILPLNMNKSV